MRKERKIYLGAFLLIIGLGLGSRTALVSPWIPDIGDWLYALMIYGIIGFVFPKWNARRIALVAILVCFGVEISQLYQADWAIRIRANRIGALVFGRNFGWIDLVSYAFGGLLGKWLEDKLLRKY